MNDLNVLKDISYTFFFRWGNTEKTIVPRNTIVSFSRSAKFYLRFFKRNGEAAQTKISLMIDDPQISDSPVIGSSIDVNLLSAIPDGEQLRKVFTLWNVYNTKRIKRYDDGMTFYNLPSDWRIHPEKGFVIQSKSITFEELASAGMTFTSIQQKPGTYVYFDVSDTQEIVSRQEQLVSLFILLPVGPVASVVLDNTILFPNSYPWSITKLITSNIKVNIPSIFTDISKIKLIVYVNGTPVEIYNPTSNPQTFFIPYGGKIQVSDWPFFVGDDDDGRYLISPRTIYPAGDGVIFRPKMVYFFDLPIEKDGEDLPVFETLVDRMTYLTKYIVASKIYGEDEDPPALPVFYGNQGTFVFTADQDNTIPAIKRANYMYVFNGYEELFFWINSAEKLERADGAMPDTYELTIEKDVFATDLQYAVNFYNSAQANNYPLNLPKFKMFKPEQASEAVFNAGGRIKIYTEAQVNYANIIDCQGVKGNATRTGALKSQGTDIVSPNDFVFVASFLTLDKGQNFSDVIWVASEQHALTDTAFGAAKNDLNAFRLASEIILRDVKTGTQKTYTCTPLHIYLIPSYWIAEDYNTQVFVKTPYSGNDSGNIMWKVNYIASRTGQGAVTIDEIQVDPRRTTWFGSLYSKKELKYRDEPYHYSVYVNTTLTPGELYVYVNFEGELIDYSADFEIGLFYSEEAQYAAQNGQTAKLNVLAGTIGTAASLFSGPIGIFGAAQSAVNTLNSWLSYQEKFKSMGSVKISGQGYLNASFAAGLSVWEYVPANDETVNETIDLYGYDVSGKITGIDFAPAFSRVVYEHFYMKGDAEGIEGTGENCKQWLKDKIKKGVRFWTQPDKM